MHACRSRRLVQPVVTSPRLKVPGRPGKRAPLCWNKTVISCLCRWSVLKKVAAAAAAAFEEGLHAAWVWWSCAANPALSSPICTPPCVNFVHHCVTCSLAVAQPVWLLWEDEGGHVAQPPAYGQLEACTDLCDSCPAFEDHFIKFVCRQLLTKGNASFLNAILCSFMVII